MTDKIPVKYEADITIKITPINRYGDKIGEEYVTITRHVEANKMSEVIAIFEDAK
jgi:hypothetical protein